MEIEAPPRLGLSRICVVIMLLACSSVRPAYADGLAFSFKNPSFSGLGYSSHVLTIDSQEQLRKKEFNDAQSAAAARALADAKSTNIAKFLNNVESRILAQLSKQLTDQLFSDTGSTSGTLVFEGTTISYVKTETEVSLSIVDDAGARTNITIPIGSFKF